MPSEDLVVVKVAPFNAESPASALRDDVTPTPLFYVRSNFPVPSLDTRTHQLTVSGAVERPLTLSLVDLQSLGTRTITTTVECAGNHRLSLFPLPTGEPWQSGAISTATWTGVPLAALLERTGVHPDTVEILATGADRGKPKDWHEQIPFARSLPLEKALHPDTLLAFEMNGEPLPAAHGAPLRLIVPRWYGMAGVKWVASIEAITERFRGYYQAQRYIYDSGDGTPPPPVTTMRVKAVITSPIADETVHVGRVPVAGRAWSGEGDITRVEVAVDGGDSWKDARVVQSSGPYAWTTWEYDWDAADPGRHALRARATDVKGNRQPDAAIWNRHGYGSNGVGPVTVNVR